MPALPNLGSAFVASHRGDYPFLSTVSVPIQQCSPAFQHARKEWNRVRSSRRSKSPFSRLKLLLLGLFSAALLPDTVYCLPGTGHALVPGRSLDSARQGSLRDLTLQNMTAGLAGSGPTCYPCSSADNDAACPSDLPREPRVFTVDTDGQKYLVDTGANRVIVNDPTLFDSYSPLQRAPKNNVKGIGGKPVTIAGLGTLTLPVTSDEGHVDRVVFQGACYVPTSPVNIVPPQMLVAALKHYGFKVDFHGDDELFVFRYAPPSKSSATRTLTCRLESNRLWYFWSKPGFTRFFKKAVSYGAEWLSFNGAVVVEDDGEGLEPPSESEGGSDDPLPTPGPQREGVTPIPFTDDDFEPLPSNPTRVAFNDDPPDSSEAEESPEMVADRKKKARLYRYHEKFGHLSFKTLRLMAYARLIPRELANVEPPKCPGCTYGTQHRKPWRSRGKQRKIKVATRPGEVVSVDQLVSPTPGFVPTHRGRPTLQRYKAATVFVDHFSDYTYVVLMIGDPTAKTTVDAKLEFERVMAQHGVKVRHYHCDNGLFDTKDFKAAVSGAGQSISFCGVNAHHQNGIAERRIRDVTENARKALLNASHRWPKAIHPSLWPAAIKNYVNQRNSLPRRFIPGEKVGRSIRGDDKYVDSPLSLLSGTQVEPNLEHFHPFGCPVYVLEEALQSQHAHNKWSDRSRVGIFLSHSPNHSTDVPLILNTTTGNVSPQYHCVYDDVFETVRRDAKSVPSLWKSKARLIEDKLPMTDVLPTEPSQSNPARLPPPSPNIPHHLVRPWETTATPSDSEGEPRDPDPETPAAHVPPDPVEQPPLPDEPPALPIGHPEGGVTRSGRRVQPNRRYFGTAVASAVCFLSTFCPSYTGSSVMMPVGSAPDSVSDLFSPVPEVEPQPYAAYVGEVVAAVANSSDPDTMTLDQAMKEPDRDKFLEAMSKELNDHIDRQHWKIVPLSSVPLYKGKRHALPMVWAMKRKRDPLGNVIKWKARLCAGGHKSLEAVDYWNTYSPVVSWSTVRLIITLALINDWHMESIDFVMAYPQAPIKTDIHMFPPKVPKDFTIPDLPGPMDRYTKVYKLLRNLYGLKDAGRTWYEYLDKGLKERGWQQSDVDTCLYTKRGILLVVYVDDAILISPNKDAIKDEISALIEAFALTSEGELKDYLGTRFERSPDGSITLTQPHMINKALGTLGLLVKGEIEARSHDTPAVSVLDKSPDDPSRKQHWHYRQVIGSLSYLQAMVRPDIAFAVQQCARFSNDPRRSHEEAVKRIGRYLIKTRDKGLVLRPDKSRGLECFVDADWAGSWQDRSSNDPLSAHSRTGFVIMFAGCPIVWVSKMQPLISLSTTEAEYIALSSALREVIALMNLMDELKKFGFPLDMPTPKVQCRVFEDNKSCIEIATNHRTRPRTKHLSVRLHHFRSWVTSGRIKIEHVSTLDQIADIFTKPLARPAFEHLRKKLMHW